MANLDMPQAEKGYIEQRRSRFRLRLTAVLGLFISLGSAWSLIWLTGVFASEEDARVTFNLEVFVECPGEVRSSVSVDSGRGIVFLNIENSKLFARGAPRLERIHQRNFFSDCIINLSSDSGIRSASISVEDRSKAKFPDDAVPFVDKVLQVFPCQGEVSCDTIRILGNTLRNSNGTIEIRPRQIFKRESFGRFTLGADIKVSNSKNVERLLTEVSLPSSMDAEVIRPEPLKIDIIPVETYVHEERPNEGARTQFLERKLFISFVDRSKLQIREALLILASTMFGAGISALLEAFLAGGTAALLKGRKKA